MLYLQGFTALACQLTLKTGSWNVTSAKRSTIPFVNCCALKGAAYHPQTNGLDEKTNDNIKRALKKLVNNQQNDWDTYLDDTLFSLRPEMHTTTKHSPFLLMYGREAVFPAEVPADMPKFSEDERLCRAQCSVASANPSYSKIAAVLILKFAEHHLSRGHINDVKTSRSAVSASRMEIACALLKCRGNVEDYCVVCSMLEGNADESMIEMV
ncbi:uncharacterized protein LOC125724079 [Brienomyrus brachyistius]|uniref:uncharacterized protein LOC125724079 n=1 Tax=Brienomyrus brachyistius TaxID=42636 RepID=UPI0020B3FF37|nr:uncharacterized protein LOC125724079 [Brienomyrus brachyistius]